MEDYIFIIIALVLSVIGAMNSSKKKRQQAMEHMGEEEGHAPRSVFEELFDDDLFMSRQEPNTVPPPVERPVAPKTKPASERQTMQAPPKMEYKPMEREGLARSHRLDQSPSAAPQLEKLSLDEEAKLSPKKLILKDFSLRKAVLYSEILNRKY